MISVGEFQVVYQQIYIPSSLEIGFHTVLFN